MKPVLLHSSCLIASAFEYDMIKKWYVNEALHTIYFLF